MKFMLMILGARETAPLEKSDSLDFLRREAEIFFPAWSLETDFLGLAVVDTTTGEVVYMAEG